MEAKPLTKEALALTEKKMDMTLDDIIKMSKNKGNKTKRPRVPNKSQRTFNNAPQDKSAKVRRFMNSRSSLRQGVLAQRRSSFQGNQFPLANEAARKAAVAPFRGPTLPRDRMVNSNKARGGFPIEKNRPPRNATVKQQQQQREEGNQVPKQRPQTLDALFANLKEQRMKAQTRPNNNSARHNGGSRKQIPPWARFGK